MIMKCSQTKLVVVKQGSSSSSSPGSEVPTATRALKQIAAKISEKRKELYADVISFIRTKLSFVLLRSCFLCLRGCRSLPKTKQRKTPLSLFMRDG